jgi:hypothetical protein
MLSDELKISLTRCLKELHLPTVRACYEEQADQARQEDITYEYFLAEVMEVLFILLAESYERGSMMITSNFPFSKWERIFKDPMTAAAAIDRLVHHSIILELNLPSYRLEHSRDKKDYKEKNICK